jgi:hypothetical protein
MDIYERLKGQTIDKPLRRRRKPGLSPMRNALAAVARSSGV